MDLGSNHITKEKVEVRVHEHPLIPFTRFTFGQCQVCISLFDNQNSYIYGGYRCNELGCEKYVIHKDCASLLPKLNHSLHPNHSLKLIILQNFEKYSCSFCGEYFNVGYCCSLCNFKLDLRCVKIPHKFARPEDSDNRHEHTLVCETAHTTYEAANILRSCRACQVKVNMSLPHYRCYPCEFVIHMDCLSFPEAYHTSHPHHQLKSLEPDQVPDYADKKCILCEEAFDQKHHQLHHCGVCNFSICRACMHNPPPVAVESSTTHEHQLHLVPRLIKFTCNACGELGDQSPYFCLQCNFMIHRQCIDLPRVININRHDHRISYTRRLGHGDWRCKVCRKKVDDFYGGYTCVKCPNFVVHSRCAIRDDIWDKRELEGIPEEEEIPPFKVIDDTTIKHFGHEHNLQINKNSHGQILPENIVCEACILQILSEPFYSCKQCDFILHEKCANYPRKKRHVLSNQLFTLVTDSCDRVEECKLCYQPFNGFRYKTRNVIIDVRCAAISDTLEHGSHQQHPLYHIWDQGACFFKCDECDYILDAKDAHFPKEIMNKRYDNHPLLLCFGDKDVVDGEYWCEACETKVNPREWFYTCYDCNTILHVSCVVGDFTYIMPGSLGERFSFYTRKPVPKVVSNNSACRPQCLVCNCRCKLSTILKFKRAGVDVYICSLECHRNLRV